MGKIHQRRRTRLLWTSLVALGVLASLPLLVGGDARSRLLAVNTLLLAAGTCSISLPLGTVLALLVVRTDMPGRRAFAVLLGILLFLPLYLQAAGWLAGFGLGGWYSLHFSALSLPPLLDGWRGAIWIHGMAATPWVALIVGIGLRLVRPELEEQALLDGSPCQVFFRLTLRRAMASVGIAALWVLVSTAADMTVSDVFQIRTYAEELYTGFSLGDDLHEAPLGVLPGTIIVVWLVVAAMILCSHVVPCDYESATRPPWVFRLGRWRRPAALFALAATLLLVGVPLGNLCHQAGLPGQRVGDTSVRTWSLAHFGQIVFESPIEHGVEFAWTLGIGSLAATAAVALAVPLAWWARRGGVSSLPVLLTTATCVAVPGPLVGMGLIALLTQPEMPLVIFLRDRTILAPWAAQWLRSLPLTTLIVWQALRTVAPETLEAAAVEGAGPPVRLWRIALAQRWGALLAAWLVALALATGDVAATASDMVVPPGIDLLSRRIAGMLHGSVYDEVAGICLTNAMAFLVIAVGAIGLLGRRSGWTVGYNGGAEQGTPNVEGTTEIPVRWEP